ncbi:PTS galactitol transporter subunit IIC [Salmonella enterica subsp. enterica serovar Adjame]|uniref:PTS galactitol transporter subunit IIC n=1 Tax=Salmonella enterica subsp. enterica serovar Adjame TaxID=2021403 RepID=A0A5H6NWV9_SALET|nr:PTS galactitol transporter subunit IIC [Salmonella enterica]EAA4389661.1 PTS galactitol transporter subunit IIC [Salmonella enterica subsp. enterica serovar Adjame]EBF8153987.1 PTS galactitol transporter subunit IIC [Salmonella enterica subsp. enterica serovar Adjame]EBG0477410.1 PTS galactitol transporter subunit IIC [Salmonella enterica subsp. enterica serovar Adjame]EBG2806417.1 PTS galactitol transporter subunit IIC [Salmonella enterica subsp. enterica serovar Adjame]EBQ5988160.1 PTS ga
MNDIAHTLYTVVQYVLGFGPTVLLPLVLFFLALFFKVKPAKALRSSLIVGIGFVGIYAIFDILTSNVGPAAQAMVERTGISLPVVDLGWPPLAAITWGSPIAPFVIPLTMLINVAMLALNKTRTVDVDMWNYWHFALAGTLVYYSTGSFVLGLSAAAIAAIVVLKLADWSAPLVAKYFGLEGISLPTLSSVVFFPIGLLFDKIIDKIPGVNRIHIDPENVQKKMGIFGEPMMVGTILGVLLGIIAGYDFKHILLLGISIGGVMFILPRMVRILMEGLLPLSEAIKKYLNAKYPGRDDLFIGLDIAIAVGNPAIISTALILTPISVFIAFLLPGNKVLPLGDLANLAVMASMIVLACRGNIFRAVITAIPVIVADLWIATKIAPFITGMAKDVNFKMAEGSSGQVSSFLDGGNPFRFWLLEIFNGNIIAIGLIPVLALVIYGVFRLTKGTVYA